MNHPIKRFKADDLGRNKTNKNLKYDLYAGQHEFSNIPNFSNQMQNFNDANNEMWKGDESKNPNNGECRKSESDDKTAENLFTSEGLQPSYADLNKIFDNSDDNSNDVRTFDNFCLTRIFTNVIFFIFSLLITHHRDQTNPLDVIPTWSSLKTKLNEIK